MCVCLVQSAVVVGAGEGETYRVCNSRYIAIKGQDNETVT